MINDWIDELVMHVIAPAMLIMIFGGVILMIVFTIIWAITGWPERWA